MVNTTNTIPSVMPTNDHNAFQLDKLGHLHVQYVKNVSYKAGNVLIWSRGAKGNV